MEWVGFELNQQTDPAIFIVAVMVEHLAVPKSGWSAGVNFNSSIFTSFELLRPLAI